MKKLTALLLVLLTVTTTLFGNDLFLYGGPKTLELADVINNKLVIQPVSIGKTYTLANNLSVVTSTNDTAVYMFPYRIAVYQKENSSAYFNETPTEYINDFKQSESLKIKNSQFVFSAQGQFYVDSECTNQTTIGTSMCNIVIEKASLYVNAGSTYAQVYLLDGKATVLDNKSSRKKKELRPGDYLVITPGAMLSPKDGGIRNLGSSFSFKELEVEENEIHTKEIKTLQTELNDVVFVNYGTNIFGVKIK